MAGQRLSIRIAGERDAPAILALRQDVDRDQAARFGKDRWITSITEASVLRGLRTSRVLIAEEAGRLAGVLRMATTKPWAIDLGYFSPARAAIYLHDVDVAPQLQRRSVGRRLITAAVDAARDWPRDTIRLDAYDGPSGAGPFYAKCGFREVGRKIYRRTPLIYYEMML